MKMKPLALGGTALAGAAGLLAGSQTWVSFMLEGNHAVETVTGHDVNPALSPVSIAIVAAALALTIAGPVFRRVLGGLVALLGAGIVVLTAGVLARPLGSLSGRITELTGIGGERGIDAVVWYDTSVWMVVGIASGALAAVLGVLIIVTGGRWAAAGRKYDASARAERSAGKPDRISDWDSLSDGEDPTSSD